MELCSPEIRNEHSKLAGVWAARGTAFCPDLNMRNKNDFPTDKESDLEGCGGSRGGHAPPPQKPVHI